MRAFHYHLFVLLECESQRLEPGFPGELRAPDMPDKKCANGCLIPTGWSHIKQGPDQPERSTRPQFKHMLQKKFDGFGLITP
jgi:hypothetical protein